MAYFTNSLDLIFTLFFFMDQVEVLSVVEEPLMNRRHHGHSLR